MQKQQNIYKNLNFIFLKTITSLRPPTLITATGDMEPGCLKGWDALMGF